MDSNENMILGVTPRVLLYTQLICFTPVFVFAVYAISQCVDFFVPVMGRLGNAVNPEYIMAPIGLAIASSFVLFVVSCSYDSGSEFFFDNGVRVT